MKQTDLLGELPDELATLWYLIRRVAGLMDRQGEVLLRRELGISLAQFLVLSVVDAHPGPLSQQAIADRVGLTKGSVSRQIDHAVAAGLMTVRVASHTRREHAVTLTEAGTTLVRHGDALTQTSRAAMQDAADPEDLTAAIRVLRSLLKRLEGADGTASRDHLSGLIGLIAIAKMVTPGSPGSCGRWGSPCCSPGPSSVSGYAGFSG